MDPNLRKEMARPMHDHLRELKAYLKQLREPFLGIKDLTDMRIQTSQLDLHDETCIDFEPRFCRPFPANDFDRIYENYAKEEENRLNDRSPSRWERTFWTAKGNSDFLHHVLVGLESAYPGHLDDKTLWVGRSVYGAYDMISSTGEDLARDYQWEMEHIRHALPLPRKPARKPGHKPRSGSSRSFVHGEVCDVARPGPAQPHLACTVVNGWAANDDKLFRSEVLAAASMLLTHVCQKATWDYHTHPAFIYSFAGRSVRVLQMHLDLRTNSFRIRMSPFIPIDSETPLHEWSDKAAFQRNEESIKLILRWMCSIPIGDTRYDDLTLEDDSRSAKEHPPTPSKRALSV
ncbi:MAG: hypothetical protein Q9160_001808 [Pyrenula sp. 1 TL-2023]